ncbi:MAG: pilus assembly protein [Dehalococcoidia bacterium]|nr:pilus assembly protein [Dehalococcoidia bacterium]
MRGYLGRWGRLGRRGERGQAIIETALLMPFIFLLILLVIEFGFFLWMNLNINNAAREGARYAAIGKAAAPDSGTCVGTQTVAGRAVAVGGARIECGEVQVWYEELALPGTSGSPVASGGDGVVVLINHPYQPITPGFGILGLGDTIAMCARVEARVEVPPASGSPSFTAGACPSASPSPTPSP